MGKSIINLERQVSLWILSLNGAKRRWGGRVSSAQKEIRLALRLVIQGGYQRDSGQDAGTLPRLRIQKRVNVSEKEWDPQY